jgi:hypothetical protein
MSAECKRRYYQLLHEEYLESFKMTIDCLKGNGYLISHDPAVEPLIRQEYPQIQVMKMPIEFVCEADSRDPDPSDFRITAVSENNNEWMRLIDYDMSDDELRRIQYLHKRHLLDFKLSNDWSCDSYDGPLVSFGTLEVNIYYLPVNDMPRLKREEYVDMTDEEFAEIVSEYQHELTDKQYAIFIAKDQIIQIGYSELEKYINQGYFIYHYLLFGEYP